MNEEEMLYARAL